MRVQIQTTFIEIEDNDAVTVGFNTTETVVNEDEQPEHEVPQCVELVGEIERPIVVGVSTAERNATGELIVCCIAHTLPLINAHIQRRILFQLLMNC